MPGPTPVPRRLVIGGVRGARGSARRPFVPEPSSGRVVEECHRRRQHLLHRQPGEFERASAGAHPADQRLDTDEARRAQLKTRLTAFQSPPLRRAAEGVQRRALTAAKRFSRAFMVQLVNYSSLEGKLPGCSRRPGVDPNSPRVDIFELLGNRNGSCPRSAERLQARRLLKIDLASRVVRTDGALPRASACPSPDGQTLVYGVQESFNPARGSTPHGVRDQRRSAPRYGRKLARHGARGVHGAVQRAQQPGRDRARHRVHRTDIDPSSRDAEDLATPRPRTPAPRTTGRRPEQRRAAQRTTRTCPRARRVLGAARRTLSFSRFSLLAPSGASFLLHPASRRRGPAQPGAGTDAAADLLVEVRTRRGRYEALRAALAAHCPPPARFFSVNTRRAWSSAAVAERCGGGGAPGGAARALPLPRTFSTATAWRTPSPAAASPPASRRTAGLEDRAKLSRCTAPTSGSSRPRTPR